MYTQKLAAIAASNANNEAAYRTPAVVPSKATNQPTLRDIKI